jgi:hypothetical protein
MRVECSRGRSLQHRAVIVYRIMSLSYIRKPLIMARSRPAAQPERPVLSVEQKQRAVARLEKRIAELEVFDPQTVQKRFTDPAVMALQAAIDEALSTALGHGTVEYRRYARATKLDHGPLTSRIDWGDASDYDDTHEARRYVAEGKQEALGLLRQAVRGLEEEIADEEPLERPAALPAR